jgi:hypothetical protein
MIWSPDPFTHIHQVEEASMMPLRPVATSIRETAMKRLAARCALLAAVLFLPASFAQAGLFRAYLASYGNDANPCTLGAPCRLLPAALAAVSAGGEIWIMDSANFNTATVAIDQDVSIQTVPGYIGSIVSTGGSAAIAASTRIKLKLRNVAIVDNVNSPGMDGLLMTGGGTLEIEDSLFSVPGVAVRVDGGVILSMHRSVVRDGDTGIDVRGSSSADISQTKFSNLTGDGVIAFSTVSGLTARAAVNDCHFGNVRIGAYAFGFVSGATAKVSVMRSTFSNGFYGVASFANTGSTAILSIGYSSISGMATAAFSTGVSGSTTQSLGNNVVTNNASNGSYVTIGTI